MLVESYEIDEIARLIAQHRPTTMFGSDDMYARLLESVPGERPFPSIKWAGYGAFNAALEDLPEQAEKRGLKLCGLYGMSEVQALYSLQPLDSPVGQRKLGGGVPVSPLAHVRVRDPESGALLGPGQPGALECAGPSLMVGYYGNEKATAEAMTPDGYVRTGDLAELDGRRRLHVPEPHGRRAAALRFPGQSARDRDAHPEAAGHRRLPDHRRARGPRACAPCRS